MMIRPHTDPTLYAPGGKLEPTAANFPCCKLFLPCTEAAGDTTLTDVIGGSILTLTNGAGSGAGYANLTGSNSALPLGRSIPVGNLAAMWLVSFDPGTVTSMELLPAAVAGWAIANNAVAIYDGAVNFSPTGALIINETGAACAKGGTASSAVFLETTNALYTANAAAAGTPGSFSDMTRITLSSIVGSAKLYGVAFFVFANGFPAANIIRDAITWSHWNWRNVTTNKGLYPGLKGIA